MKVLYLTPGCFDKGGISRYSRYQISALRDICGKGEVRVLSLLGPQGDSFEEPFEVTWHAGGNDLISKWRFMTKATEQVFLWRPDIIHTAHVNFSGFAKVLATLCGARTVLNTYGLEVWSGLSRDAAFGLKRTERVISDCHFTADYLETEGWRARGSTTVIWDCVDTGRFSPNSADPEVVRRYGIPDPGQYFNIMTLGRLSFAAAHKGYDRLLQVFATVAGKEPRARLVIAGRGDMVETLRRLAKELEVGERVVFTGAVDEGDMADVYRCAHLFSLVSDRGPGRGEGIPLTPLEAMACGVPIIVGNHDGSQEAVVDGRNGYVIDPFDLARHAEITLTLGRDRDHRNRLANAAADVARSVFSYEGFLDKHRSFYAQFLGRG